MDGDFEKWWECEGCIKAEPLTLRAPYYDEIKRAFQIAYAAGRHDGHQHKEEPLSEQEEADIAADQDELKW